jgi:TolB-like protein/DNA-binding SARP family transcriptional activator
MNRQANAPLQIRLLGGFAVTVPDGTDLTPPGKKLRALVACLALQPRATWSRDRLTGLLWGDREEEQARGSLRQALAELRRSLGESVLLADRETVAFDPATVHVDTVEFAGFIKREELTEAAELYRGDLLEGVSLPDKGFSDWLLVEQTRLHDLCVSVLARLADCQSGDAAIGTTQRLLQLDPTREEAHRRLMRLHAKQGDRAQALRQYRICRDALRRELGVDPESETEQLRSNIERLRTSSASAVDRPISLPPDKPPQPAAISAELTPSARAPRSWHRPAALAVVLVVLAAVGAAAWSFYPRTVPQDGRPSIAVLPFGNLSGDDATGRLADGITEDIITDLARFRDLDIIARNSAMTYKGKPIDVRQVGRDLNVRYVLEGSIQRENQRVRVSAQLIDATTGAHLWSERWDRPAIDVFAVQTEVAERTVSTLAGYNLLLKDTQVAAKRKRPTDLKAYDFYALAYEAFLRGTESDLEQGLRYADAAIERDPSLVGGYTKKAWILNSLTTYRKNWVETYVEMERLARLAIAIDPYDAEAYSVLAFAETLLGRLPEAKAATERMLTLNPSSADLLSLAANTLPYLGRPEEGAAMCDRAFRLNPVPPDWYFWNCQDSYFFTRRFQATIDAINRWGANHDLNHYTLIFRAASETELGRDQDAAATKAELQRRYPEVSFEYLLNTGLYFEREQEEQQMLASVRKAGIRICATDQELRDVASPRHLPECIAH